MQLNVRKNEGFHTRDIRNLPTHVMELIFTFLDLNDVFSSMLACRRWYSIIYGKQRIVFKSLVLKTLPKAALEDVRIVNIFPDSRDFLRAFSYAWSPKDISGTMSICSNGFTVYRRPIAQCTDAVRGKRSVTHGIHAFDFVWHTPFGTAAVIGLATESERLHCRGYDSLLGKSQFSWGWNIVDKVTVQMGKSNAYPKCPNIQPVKIGQKIRLIIDCDHHVAGFERGEDFFGIAFTELPAVPLYPAVAAVYGHSEVSMYYIGPPDLG
uniref:F-box protein n=1 Tax=Panagrolaimus superbus TaxID=310955 RepID=A0A914XRL5_9BILA